MTPDFPGATLGCALLGVAAALLVGGAACAAGDEAAEMLGQHRRVGCLCCGVFEYFSHRLREIRMRPTQGVRQLGEHAPGGPGW